jgi:Methylamine utilisation protein MauE
MTLSSSIFAFVGFLQLRSAIAKIRQPAVFWAILQRYPGIVWVRNSKLALLVPATEAVLGTGLLLPFFWTRLPAGFGVALFLILASAAIYWRYHRGEKRFACGCSTDLAEELPASAMLLKNALLFLVTSYAMWAHWKPVSAGDYGLGAALLLAFNLLDTALAQEGRIHNWKSVG